MRVRVLYHDHCFDGAASAAFFSRFAREKFYGAADFSYLGMMHMPSQTWDEAVFDGDVNAIVDFKYAATEKLTWWFDHHQSAFLTPEDADYFKRANRPWHFFDPHYRSCTKFICTVARERFGYEAPDLNELVEWADIVDGAQYRDAKEAVEIELPATKLVLVIEGAKGSEIVHHIIRLMQRERLEAIAENSQVQEWFRPLYQQHVRSMDLIERRSHYDRGVVFFDLADDGVEGYNKFIPYYLHPESIYTVSVMTASFRTKISVGSNPWAKGELKHNLASICERYGGGGHPRVGAISLPVGALAEARRVAAEIVEELRSDY
ncbi:MAG: phosphoesterase [Bryobacterales bacterium]|nr:phosphoesterase [Bryobacterales bacterium]